MCMLWYCFSSDKRNERSCFCAGLPSMLWKCLCNFLCETVYCWSESSVSSFTHSNASNWSEIALTRRQFHLKHMGDKEIYANVLALNSQYSQRTVFWLFLSLLQRWLTAIQLFSGHADVTLQIWLSFSQWSEPQSNYSSGTVITQSLSMHLITGVLTKNNRSWTPFTQNEIWRRDSEMITACKSSHKIGGYYVSYSNGLFNKTLITCIILHSSLL